MTITTGLCNMATLGVKEVCLILVLFLLLDYAATTGPDQIVFSDENQSIFEPRNFLGHGHG